MPYTQATTTAVDLDRLTQAELEELEEKTAEHIQAIKALWSGAVRLEEAERRTSVGRNLPALSGPLQRLFGALRESPDLAKAFDVLGGQDHGDDPDRFEIELLERRLGRVQAQRRMADALQDVARHLDDDALVTSEQVVSPGLLALGLARTLGKTNPAFRSALAPVLDAFRELTKRARSKRAENAAARKADATPKP
jgi:hypothetical protein